MGFLPLFEAWTRITTDQTLLELADLNRPLLKRLSLEASGSYAHSINVANLSEAAARGIGANALLARVGSYYHDVGKMATPQYFVENQARGRNPHDRLDPAMSAAIVRAHVIEGMRMADQAKLPDIVKDFIPEHHGTQPIGFFYEQAKKQNPEAELDVADFSYAGPAPRSRETAIVMLADSVESATKALQDPTEERIRALVDRIVESKIDQGQFDETPLTLAEIATIKRHFVSVLSGMYHHRVDYPAEAISRGRTPANGGAASPGDGGDHAAAGGDHAAHADPQADPAGAAPAVDRPDGEPSRAGRGGS
jgi:cyclic-di-AMP phosphodiesterase PgpH